MGDPQRLSSYRIFYFIVDFIKIELGVIYMLTIKQKDLLASVIIGDGCICKDKSCNSYYLQIGHGESQKDYCAWKMELLNNSGIFKKRKNLHSRKIYYNDKIFIQYCVKFCDYCLKFCYDGFIINGKKSLKTILRFLKTDIGVSIWFMDDGSVEEGRWKDKNGVKHITRPSLKLCTHGFTLEENIYAQQWFKNKYGIICSIKKETKKGKEYYYLKFNVDSTQQVYEKILKQYVECCESMKYKFRHLINYYK